MNTRFLTVCLLVFVLLISQAFAATVSVSDVALNLDNAVKRSNPLPEGNNDNIDDVDELEYASFNIPVTASDGSVTVTAINVDTGSFTYDSFGNPISNSDIVRVETNLPVTITDATQNVRVSVLVPSNLDAINSNFEAVQHTVSADVVTDAGTDTAQLSFFAENNLVFDAIEIIIDGETYDCDEDDEGDCDDEVEEISPDDSVSIRVCAQNEFDEDDELDFEDVEFEIDSDNSDVDPDDNSEDTDVDADEEECVTFDMDIDNDVEDGDDAEIELTLLVDDENGAQHGGEYKFQLEFELPEGIVEFDTFLVNPSTVCPGDTTAVEFIIENEGSDDQDNVRLQFQNNQLGLDTILSGIDLDDAEEGRDSEFDDQISFNIPRSTQPGPYQIRGTVFYEDDDNDDTSRFETVELTVRDCFGTATNNNNNNDQGSNNNDDSNDQDDRPVIIVQQPTTQQPDNTDSGQVSGGVTTATPVRATQTSDSDAMFVTIMIILIVVLGLVVGYLIFALARR